MLCSIEKAAGMGNEDGKRRSKKMRGLAAVDESEYSRWAIEWIGELSFHEAPVVRAL